MSTVEPDPTPAIGSAGIETTFTSSSSNSSSSNSSSSSDIPPPSSDLTKDERGFVLEPLYPGHAWLPHQIDALISLLKMEHEGFKCGPHGLSKYPVRIKSSLLAFAMGLGKTMTALGLAASNPLAKTLVICPSPLITMWVENALKAGFVVHRHTGSGGKARWTKIRPGSATRTTEIYITSYDSLTYRPQLTDGGGWDRVIFDESHIFRNHTTRRYKRVAALVKGIPHRLLLTGTPIVNKVKDAVAQLAIMGVPATQGKDWYDSYYKPFLPHVVCYKSMDEVRDTVDGMPPRPDITDVELEPTCEEEAEHYFRLQLLTKQMERAFREGRTAEGLELLLRLRQCSLSPELLPSDLIARHGIDWTPGRPSAKMQEIHRRVQAEPTKKFLVFCWFHKEMSLMADMLAVDGINVEQYHGGMSEAYRNEVLDRARLPECQVLLIQIRSGGVGLNLQEFNRVIFTSPYWTSAMMDQAIARAVRFGQTEVVQVFHLLIKTELGRNIDTFTADIAEGKRCLLEAFFEMAGGAREEEDDDGPVPEPEAHAGPDPEVPLTRMEALAVLGVTNSSDQEAIGKAYRTLVLKWHPDKNIGNEVAATVKFRRIQEAYELLTA